jgi:hypothetical protein
VNPDPDQIKSGSRVLIPKNGRKKIQQRALKREYPAHFALLDLDTDPRTPVNRDQIRIRIQSTA